MENVQVVFTYPEKDLVSKSVMFLLFNLFKPCKYKFFKTNANIMDI